MLYNTSQNTHFIVLHRWYTGIGGYGGYMDDDAPKIGLSIMEFGSYGIEPQLIKLDFIIYLLENLESY